MLIITLGFEEFNVSFTEQNPTSVHSEVQHVGKPNGCKHTVVFALISPRQQCLPSPL